MRLFAALILVLIVSFAAFGQTYTINTLVGGALPQNISALSASLGNISSVAADAQGNVYLALPDYATVLKMDTNGNLTLFAGTGAIGFSGDGEAATNAQLSYPSALAVDTNGNVYIADEPMSSSGTRIREVSGGVITTIAGGGTNTGEGISATSAQLWAVSHLAVDKNGVLYLYDGGENGSIPPRIRKVSSGTISTIAGGGTAAIGTGPATGADLSCLGGMAVDGNGNLYVTIEWNYSLVREISGGTIATIAGIESTTGYGYSGNNGPAVSAQLDSPTGITVDGAGDIFFVDTGNYVVREIDTTKKITTVAGNGTAGFSGDGGAATSAELYFSCDYDGCLARIAVDSNENLYIGGSGSSTIREVSKAIINTVAGQGYGLGGNGGPGSGVQLLYPGSVATDAAGDVYIADNLHFRVLEYSNNSVTTAVSPPPNSNGPQFGEFYVATDPAGNLYYADQVLAHELSNGTVTVAAGTPGEITLSLGGLAADANGDVFISNSILGTVSEYVNGNGTVVLGCRSGLCPPTWTTNVPPLSVGLSSPAGVAVDPAGNLYVADAGMGVVWEVSNGVANIVAGSGPYGIGSIGDWGPATSATLQHPTGIAVDASGNLYIADTYDQRIRKVSGGVITTIAGTGTFGFGGDGGPGTSAELNFPWGVAVDGAGNVYVADTDNQRIRILTPSGTPCTYSVNVSNTSFDAAGGSLTATIQTGASCFWGIGGVPSWITPSTTSGTGNATVTLDVTANVAIQRTATFGIAGTIVSISQSMGCTFSVSGGPFTGLAASTFPVSIAVQASDSSCPWTVSSLPSWVSTGGGTGSLNLQLGIATNTGPQRSATITVAGASVTITQNSGCAYSVTPFSAQISASGGSINFNVQTDPACMWSVSNLPAWLTLSGNSGTSGPGTLTLAAVSNQGNQRTVTITVAGVAEPVTQDSGCTFTLNPNVISGTAAGGSVGVALQTGTGCAWSISGVPAWASANGSSSGSGSANLSFTLATNNGSLRSASLLVAGLPVPVVQNAAGGPAPGIVPGAESYVINSIAGGGTGLPNGQLALGAYLSSPGALKFDANGNLYVLDNFGAAILALNSSGYFNVVAGTGVTGYTGDKGPATSAQIYAADFAIDGAADIYVLDQTDSVVREISGGVITTVAGTGTAGYGGDGGSAIKAHLNGPRGIAVDTAGNVYIADTGNNRIRKIANGTMSTVGGTGTGGDTGDNGPATLAEISRPTALTVDSQGNLYFVDDGGIRQISPAGVINTVLTTDANFSSLLATDAAGNLYIAGDIYLPSTGWSDGLNKLANGVATQVIQSCCGFLGDGGLAQYASASINGFAIDSQGSVFISGDNRIREISNGIINTIAGGGGDAYGDGDLVKNAPLNPAGVALDSTGNLYVLDGISHSVREISAGVISSVAGTTYIYNGLNGGIAVDGSGNIYAVDSYTSKAFEVSDGVPTTLAGTGSWSYSGDNGPATLATLFFPDSVALDGASNIFIADQYNQRIRKIDKTGIITTVAGIGLGGYNGDNIPATSANLFMPGAVTVDSQGNLYIADTWNYRIRKVDTNGIITTVAGNGVHGFSGDGGPATSAELNGPVAVAVDPQGNIFIGEVDSQVYGGGGFNGSRIRKVTNGIITTIAGTGAAGFSGDGGPATSAQVYSPMGFALDNSGNLYFADANSFGAPSNGYIRVLSPSPCVYALDQASLAAAAGGGNLPVSIQTSPSCPWTISGLPNWLTVSGSAAGAGGGPITLVAAANASGASRSANVSIGGITVPVSQASAPSSGGEAGGGGGGLLGNCDISLGSTSASLTAEGGSGSFKLTTIFGCGWSISGAPSWITFPNGTTGSNSATINFQVAANSGATRSGTFNVSGMPFTVTEGSLGSMAQIASAGGWDTTLTLVNLGSSSADLELDFFGSDGNSSQLPFTFPQQAGQNATTAASLDQTLNANATLVVDTTGPVTQTAVTGWSQLLTSGSIDGFATFKNTVSNQQAVVPLEARDASSYLLAFDNTGVVATGLAITNLATSPASVGVIIRGDTGAQIGTGTISLAAGGHNSFMLTDSTYGFPITANKRGTVEFDTPQGGRISVLGLRANGSALTTLPVLANVGSTGGTMAHVAAGGGWQTIFTLVNTGNSAAGAALSFFADNGNVVSLPLVLPQTGQSITESWVSQAIPAGGTLIVATQGQNSGSPMTGSALLTTTANISGFAIFQNTAAGQEAVVPLETRNDSSYVLAFDNTGNLGTGVALSNISGLAGNVNLILRDDTGAQIGTDTISLTPNQHLSFMLTTNYAATANKRGTVQFSTAQAGQIAVLGIRATPAGAFTTIPALAD